MSEQNRDRAFFEAAMGRTESCPSIEALAGAAENPEIRKHVDECVHCRSELALMQSFETADPRPEEVASVQWIEGELLRRPPVVAVPPQRSAWPRLWDVIGFGLRPHPRAAISMAAACLVVGVIGAVYFQRGRTPEITGPDSSAVMRSSHIAPVGPVGDIDQPPSEFRWEAVPGAARYEFRLLEVDRTMVWSTQSANSQLDIPAEIRVRMVPARSFLWEVSALNSSGEKIGSTDLQTFHILATKH